MEVTALDCPAQEEPGIASEPDSADDDEDDENDKDYDDTCSSILYGALHGLEPLEPGAEPRQRIGTSKCGISKKSWTKAEDAILTDIVQKYGAQRWSSVAAQLPGRAGKQCRERWFNHLCPEVKKGAWTSEEDRVIMESVARYGTRWSKIVKLMPGRTDNAIKNRYNSAMRRLKRQERLKGGKESVLKHMLASHETKIQAVAGAAMTLTVAHPASESSTSSGSEAVPVEVTALPTPVPMSARKPAKRKREDSAAAICPNTKPVADESGTRDSDGAAAAAFVLDNNAAPPIAPSRLEPCDIIAPTVVPLDAMPPAEISADMSLSERHSSAVTSAKTDVSEQGSAQNVMAPPKKSPRRRATKAKTTRVAPGQLDENLRAAGLSPPPGVSPLQLAQLLASQPVSNDDPTLSALQELFLNNVSPQPQQTSMTGNEHISPSSQILMLLEENGITGPPIHKEDDVADGPSPFDFSNAYYSVGARQAGTMPPPPPASAKDKKAHCILKRQTMTSKIEADSLPKMPSDMLLPPRRRESEDGNEKRLSGGTILDFFKEVEDASIGGRRDGVEALQSMANAPSAAACSGKTPVAQASLESLHVEGNLAKPSGDGTSPTVAQLSPINPVQLTDLLTAF